MDLGTGILLLLWGALAASVILRLRRRGAEAFDDVFTPRDRRVVGGAAFYLAVPALVLLSQLVQIALLEIQGAGLGRFESFVFWGVVEPARPEALGLYERAAIALAGPITLLFFVVVFVAWTHRRPSGAAYNFLRLEIARVTMSLALGLHPIASILTEEGDYWALRTALNEASAPMGDGAILVMGVLAALSFWLWRRAGRLRQLATTVHDELRHAEAALEETPGDPEALRAYGAAQLATGDPRALGTLEKALALEPDDPRTQLLVGKAYLRGGEAESASSHLRRAGQLAEDADADPPLLFEITLALSAARIALGDAEGALLTAEAAHQARPADPRGLLMIADALVADDRPSEARDQLEAALETADGIVRAEIERRLKDLRRR